MFVEVIFIAVSAILFATFYMKMYGANKIFYKAERNAIKFENKQLVQISTLTSDSVKLGGFLIYPENHEEAKYTVLYLHGISIRPSKKIPEMIDFAN